MLVFIQLDANKSLKINGQLEYKSAAEKKPHVKKYFEDYKKNMLNYIQSTTHPAIALSTARQFKKYQYMYDASYYNKEEMKKDIIKILSDRFPAHEQITNYIKVLELLENVKNF